MERGMIITEDWSCSRDNCYLSYITLYLFEMRRDVPPRLIDTFGSIAGVTLGGTVLQVDVDGDGVIDPAQLKTLTGRTLRRAERTMSTATSARHRRHWGVADSRSAHGYRPERDLPHTITKAARDQNHAIDRKATELSMAVDPHHFGGTTFSQCVQHLDRLIASGESVNSDKTN